MASDDHRVPDVEWVALKSAFVEYPKGDMIGRVLAYICLSPILIFSGFVTLILFRRDLHTVLFFVGVVGNEFVNLILKHLIAQPRPDHRSTGMIDYGMPSGHSQFIWFFAAYVAYFVFVRLHHINNNTTLEYFWKTTIVFGSFFVAILTSIGRVYLQYHTWQQVACGMLLGIVNGSIWFALVHFAFTPYFPYIASWRISEFMLLRDTTLIPNVLWFEYTNAMRESRTRGRKLVSMKSQ
ncbi:acidPPc [Nesidiocoris tenuis]|uniref:Dolichyldiphosphatase n=1 Tax=Nesidiocoris tenuis TaxID=355587 RepID=A0ABN7B6K7_9HEMI|nr:acidPPc [Nesidiocoris tenuis]